VNFCLLVKKVENPLETEVNSLDFVDWQPVSFEVRVDLLLRGFVDVRKHAGAEIKSLF